MNSAGTTESIKMGMNFKVRLILLSGLMSRLRDSLSFNEDSSPESFGISAKYSSEHVKDTQRNFMGINVVNRFAAARQCEPSASALLRLWSIWSKSALIVLVLVLNNSKEA